MVSEELKLVSIEGEDEENVKEEEQPSGAGATLLSDEEVNLVPIEGEDEEKTMEEEQPSGADATLMSDEELARMLQVILCCSFHYLLRFYRKLKLDMFCFAMCSVGRGRGAYVAAFFCESTRWTY